MPPAHCLVGDSGFFSFCEVAVNCHIFDVLCEKLRCVYGDKRSGNQRPLLRHLLECIHYIGYVSVEDLAGLLRHNIGGIVGKFCSTTTLLGKANPPAAVFGFALNNLLFATFRTSPLLIAVAILFFPRITRSVPLAHKQTAAPQLAFVMIKKEGFTAVIFACPVLNGGDDLEL